MSGILVGRHINGNAFNGLEFLLEEDGVDLLRFQDEQEAKLFLKAHALTDEQINDLWFIEEDDGEGECEND